MGKDPHMHSDWEPKQLLHKGIREKGFGLRWKQRIEGGGKSCLVSVKYLRNTDQGIKKKWEPRLPWEILWERL